MPNVRRITEDLTSIGIDRITVVIGPWSASIQSALHGVGADVAFVEPPPGSGTAGAVLAGSKLIDEKTFLVVYGDTVTTISNLKAVSTAHESMGAGAAILYDDMPLGEGSVWYGAEVDGDRLASIIGREADSIHRLCGVFALNREILPLLESNPGLMTRVPVGGMPPAEPDLAQSIAEWDIEIAAVRAADVVVDMDKPWHILEANSKMAAHLAGCLTENRIHPSASIHDGAELAGFVELGVNSVIGNRVVAAGNIIAGSNTKIVNGPIFQGHAIIGQDTRVSDYCLVDHNAVIGNGCVVGHGAEIDGVMFDGAYLYHYCEISGLVGASVDIGAATVCGTLRFDDDRAEHIVKGRRERPLTGANATYFGDYSRTGVNVITMPGVKIGAYSCVGAGIVLYEDIPSRTLRLLQQDTVDRTWGPERYGW